MKRYRAVSHDIGELFEAPSQRQKTSNVKNADVDHRDDSAVDTTNKPNDGRLSLLSIVCEEHLTDKNDGKSEEQGISQETKAESIPQQIIPDDKAERKQAVVSALKSAEEILRITSSALISPSDDDVSVAGKPLEPPRHVITRSKPKPALISKDGTMEETSIWEDVFRPVPLPPRLPMVPAGFVFPLYKSPDIVAP